MPSLFLTTYSLILIFPIFYNICIMDANAIECENLKICVYDWRLPVNGMRFMHQNLGEGVSLYIRIFIHTSLDLSLYFDNQVEGGPCVENFHIGWAIPINNRKNVSLQSRQTNLNRNPSNSFYIFLVYMNFENLTIRLHFLLYPQCFQNFKK